MNRAQDRFDGSQNTIPKVTVHRHRPDMERLADEVGERAIRLLKQTPPRCVFLNPIATVICEAPTAEFFREVRRQQASWCRRSSSTFPRQIRRRPSRWVSGGEFLRDKFGRFLDRALCFTGALFINGRFVPPHAWPEEDKQHSP